MEGKSLLALLADQGTFNLERKLAIVSPEADALGGASTIGDIKPANIMVLPDGRPQIRTSTGSSGEPTGGSPLGSKSSVDIRAPAADPLAPDRERQRESIN